MIRPGQVYESVHGPHLRIRVTSGPVEKLCSRGKAQIVTLTDDGREVRPRWIETSQLHESGTTKAGAPRRTGYRLVQDAPAGGAR